MRDTIPIDILAIDIMDRHSSDTHKMRRALIEEKIVTTHAAAQTEYVTPYLIVRSVLTAETPPLKPENRSTERSQEIMEALSYLAAAETVSIAAIALSST